jgi:hypothetical protein
VHVASVFPLADHDRLVRAWGPYTNEQSKDYFFVILSAAKNLSFKAAEILHSAALCSE